MSASGGCDRCVADMVCPSCKRSHDVPGISHNIDGEGWHVHDCPWCGVDFQAYAQGVKELLGE